MAIYRYRFDSDRRETAFSPLDTYKLLLLTFTTEVHIASDVDIARSCQNPHIGPDKAIILNCAESGFLLALPQYHQIKWSGPGCHYQVRTPVPIGNRWLSPSATGPMGQAFFVLVPSCTAVQPKEGNMANIETRLLSKILDTQDLKPLAKANISSNYFYGPHRCVFMYIRDYYKMYGVIPSLKVVKRRYPKFVLENTRKEPYQALIDELLEREIYNAVRNAIENTAGIIVNDTERAYQTLSKAMNGIAEMRAVHELPVPTNNSDWAKPVSLGKIPEPPVENPILGGLIAKGHSTILHGEGGKGKSYIALGLATAMASGHRFLGFPLDKERVLYLDWELSQDEQRRRAGRIARGMGLKHPPKKLYYLPLCTGLPSIMNRLRHLIHKRKFALVIIDSFGPAGGIDSEAAKEVTPLFMDLRKLGVSTLVLDHQAKNQEGHKTPFGSIYKFNLARSVLRIEQAENTDDSLTVGLHQTKSNFGSRAKLRAIKIHFSPSKIIFDEVDPNTLPALQQTQQAGSIILSDLQNNGPATINKISVRTGLPEKTIANELPRLAKSGKTLTATKKGRKKVWSLPNPQPPKTYSNGELGDSLLTTPAKHKNGDESQKTNEKRPQQSEAA